MNSSSKFFALALAALLIPACNSDDSSPAPGSASNDTFPQAVAISELKTNQNSGGAYVAAGSSVYFVGSSGKCRSLNMQLRNLLST
jgi:outer membrane biogenesis lipoprotein LolB